MRVTHGCLDRSPGGGLHLIFRTDEPATSQKLARRPATDEELVRSPDDKIKVLIETRGEGGYLVVPPSHGPTHASGRAWEVVRGGLDSIATIAVEERDALYDVARSLDAMPVREHAARGPGSGDRPGDRYDAQPDAEARIEALLVAHGWTVVYRRGDVTYLRRPGKEDRGISATLGHHPGLLYVFSTSTAFEAPRGYRPFAVYAILGHGGDFSAAAKALGGGERLGAEGTRSGDSDDDGSGPGRLRLPYRTVRDIADATHPEPDWIVFGYVARQAITELDGKVKAAGKTTLIAHGVRAILDGTPFLGAPTTRTRVIWLTEQQPEPFREVLDGAGLLERVDDDLLILFRGDITGSPWAEVIGAMTEDALAEGYGLLIVDTLGKLAGVREENDAAEWARAMVPLQDAAHHGLAVWVARHDRKSGGALGESGRGSSQVSGDVDIILRLGRPEGSHPPTYRLLEALSRYRVTPERAVIELTDAGYVRAGDEDAVELAAVKAAVRDHLPTLGVDVWSQTPGPTEQDLITALGKPRATVRRAIAMLLAEGTIVRTGEGKRGDPYLYYRAAGVSDQPSSATSDAPGHEADDPEHGTRASGVADRTSNPSAECLVTNGDGQPATDLRAEAEAAFAELGGRWMS